MPLNWPDVPQLYSIASVYEDRWKYVYPGVDVDREILKMAEWIEANPARKPKKCWKKFMVAWLSRAHTRLLEVEVRETVQRLQRHVDASVGLWEGYK